MESMQAHENAALDALRALRRERAGTNPPYTVLDNATIERLVTLRPRTRDALARVPGIGPGRLAAIGDDLLVILERLPDPPTTPLELRLPAGVHAALADAAAASARSIEDEAMTGIRVYIRAREGFMQEGYTRPRSRIPG